MSDDPTDSSESSDGPEELEETSSSGFEGVSDANEVLRHFCQKHSSITSSSTLLCRHAMPVQTNQLLSSHTQWCFLAQDITFGERLQESQAGHLQKGQFSGSAHAAAKQQDHRKASKQLSKAPATLPTTKFKRENKNRPAEQSSKRPVPRFREIIETSKRQEPFVMLTAFSLGAHV